MYKFGDILTTYFPFTDLKGAKKRPALFILNAKDGDVLVARITSKISMTDTDFAISDLALAGLPVSSWIRLTKLACIDGRLVDRKIGELSTKDLAKAKSIIETIVEDL